MSEVGEQEQNLQKILGELEVFLGCGSLLAFYQEIKGRSDIILELEDSVRDEPHFDTKRFVDVFELRLYRIINYVLVREFAPEVFIETGVLHGLTSQFILHGIERNGKGRLISVDYPSYAETGPTNVDGYEATLPPGREPGWAVSDRYRNLWQLVLGKSLEELPSILAGLDGIGIFLHDSEHTYGTMWGEMALAWEKLTPGGLLVCDNVGDNASFLNFCRTQNRHPFVFPFRLDGTNWGVRFGLIQK